MQFKEPCHIASSNHRYNTLVSAMSEENRKSLENVVTITEQRRAARESKTIEQAGGEEPFFI